jgi:hypothetical protein
MTTSGFSFKKRSDGKLVGIEGQEVRPHRIDLIKQGMANGEDVSDLFYDFDRDDCETSLTLEQLQEEMALYEEWFESDRAA